ncbi:DUF1800 domain-containing protein [Andreprevotia chitinilytica]|uniref:DUF1800 domain-containing protein n=1 Tax=Andreprevotia chitinilytica TaxID=396808 RepID=UPI00068B633B|nr:DUF1800 domain-containing protein [Andreprevotia chitinilytica]
MPHRLRYRTATCALLLLSCMTYAAEKQPDLHWLNRLSFGVTSDLVARDKQLGDRAFLDEQLRAKGDMPIDIQARIEALPITQKTIPEFVAQDEDMKRQVNAATTEEDKKQLSKAEGDFTNQAMQDAMRRHLWRAIYSPNQLQEKLTWFWMNHFSVYAYKANLRLTIPDYEEKAVRPYALGHFRDLVLATLKHPAMLAYLDNTQNAAGHINENYARELMELHTLGVGSGYTQQDVQELARILTGVGVNYNNPTVKVKAELQQYVIRNGAFEFNPQRHDFGDKQLLGATIKGSGFAEVEQAVDLICKQPATARFVSRKLATYFLGDNPPDALVEKMAKTFQRSDGDIAAVVRTLFESPASHSPTPNLRDPFRYTVAAMRLAYDGKPVSNLRPVFNWLNQLGEPLYGRLSPDGYGLTSAAWNGSGQLVKRFEIARAIGSNNAGLFDPDGSTPMGMNGVGIIGFPLIQRPIYYSLLEPTLSPATRETLDRANSAQEWNLLYLASPEMMND